VGPIIPPSCHTGVCCIIATTKYLTKWVEVALVKNCTTKTVAQFILDNVITRFGWSKMLMSGQGSHFLNLTIQELTQRVVIHHQKSTPYHPKAKGTIESFDKILEHALNKFFNL
jgi:transposase InsO family protein